MQTINLHTKDGQSHPIKLSSKGLSQLKRNLGLVLYNEQGQLEPHSAAELIVQDEQGNSLFQAKATELQPYITYD